jgi:hypothetical protein
MNRRVIQSKIPGALFAQIFSGIAPQQRSKGRVGAFPPGQKTLISS